MVIFLDVDGVLNGQSDWAVKYSFRKSCIDILSQIVRETGAKGIVMVSTWRACQGDTTPEFFTELIKSMEERNIKIIGYTPITKHTREEEVLYYARRHECGNYLIIDDDESLYPNRDTLPLYVPNYRTGLISEDIRKCLKMWKKYWKGRNV